MKTPKKFLWSVKASCYITHLKRLREPQKSLEIFTARWKISGQKLGPILFQLPPWLMYNEDVFKSFWFYVKIGHRYTREPRNEAGSMIRSGEILQVQYSAVHIRDRGAFSIQGGGLGRFRAHALALPTVPLCLVLHG